MTARLTLLPHGPIKVEGDFTLLDGDGNAYDAAGRKALYLCRCGASRNKPLCDGSHGPCGFQEAGPARVLGR